MNERLVSVKKYNPNIIELPIIKRIETKHPLMVRDGVAKKIASVANKLPEEFSLQIDSGYRSRRSQEIIWSVRMSQFNNYKKTKDLVFDPDTGIPPHTTGGAIDISLIEKSTNLEVNLSDPFAKYYAEPQLISKKISSYAQKLRLMIHDLMLEEKFAPNPKEYWHFSYGDESWAEFYKKKILYNEIDSEEVPTFSNPQIFLFGLLRKGFRLKNKLLKTKTNY